MTRVLAAAFAVHRETLEALEGMTSVAQLERLYTLARAVTTGCIVEVGSYRGRSTSALALGSIDGHDVPVFAIEPHAASNGEPGGRSGAPDRAAFFTAMLATDAWQAVRLVSLISEVVTAGWDRPVSLLWIDGDHSYETVAAQYRCWEGQLADGAVVAFDGTASPALGPARLVAELVESGRWRVDGEVGEMAVLRPVT